MDQTAVLTTLIGGMLAIVGGFLGTYFTQMITNKTEKKKNMRGKIDELYSLINEIDNKATQYFVEIGILMAIGEEHKKIILLASKLITEGNIYVNKVEMICDIYVRSMRVEAQVYCNKVKDIFMNINQSIYDRALDQSEIDLTIFKASEELNLLNIRFKSKVAKLIDKLL